MIRLCEKRTLFEKGVVSFPVIMASTSSCIAECIKKNEVAEAMIFMGKRARLAFS